MKRLQMLALSLLLVAFPLWAESTVSVKIELLRLTAHDLSEESGDELYTDITVYRANERPENFQIPEKPLSWPSRHLDKVKKVLLWEGEVPNEQSANFIISLVEQDSSPFDPDDLIGTVRLRLKNNDGSLESSWSMPNRNSAAVSITTKYGRAERFNLNGENSLYEMILLLTVLVKDS